MFEISDKMRSELLAIFDSAEQQISDGADNPDEIRQQAHQAATEYVREQLAHSLVRTIQEKTATVKSPSEVPVTTDSTSAAQQELAARKIQQFVRKRAKIKQHRATGLQDGKLKFNQALYKPSPAQVDTLQLTRAKTFRPAHETRVIDLAFSRRVHLSFKKTTQALELMLPEVSYEHNNSDVNPKPIYCLHTENKSNGWFCELSEDYLSKVHGDQYKRLAMEGIGDDFEIKTKVEDGSTLLYIDDCSYSGTQIIRLLDYLNEYADQNNIKDLNIKIVLPFISQRALERIKHEAKNARNINIQLHYKNIIPNIPVSLQSGLKQETVDEVANAAGQEDDPRIKGILDNLLRQLNQMQISDRIVCPIFYQLITGNLPPRDRDLHALLRDKTIAYTDAAIPDGASTLHGFPGELTAYDDRQCNLIRTSGKPYKLSDLWLNFDNPLYEQIRDYFNNIETQGNSSLLPQKLTAVYEDTDVTLLAKDYNLLAIAIFSNQFNFIYNPLLCKISTKTDVKAVKLILDKAKGIDNSETKDLVLLKLLSNKYVFYHRSGALLISGNDKERDSDAREIIKELNSAYHAVSDPYIKAQIAAKIPIELREEITRLPQPSLLTRMFSTAHTPPAIAAAEPEAVVTTSEPDMATSADSGVQFASVNFLKSLLGM